MRHTIPACSLRPFVPSKQQPRPHADVSSIQSQKTNQHPGRFTSYAAEFVAAIRAMSPGVTLGAARFQRWRRRIDKNRTGVACNSRSGKRPANHRAGEGSGGQLSATEAILVERDAALAAAVHT
jgi:hypothetical protein